MLLRHLNLADYQPEAPESGFLRKFDPAACASCL
jgi:hypothetical protein